MLSHRYEKWFHRVDLMYPESTSERSSDPPHQGLFSIKFTVSPNWTLRPKAIVTHQLIRKVSRIHPSELSFWILLVKNVSIAHLAKRVEPAFHVGCLHGSSNQERGIKEIQSAEMLYIEAENREK